MANISEASFEYATLSDPEYQLTPSESEVLMNMNSPDEYQNKYQILCLIRLSN
jgi:hypothetical protein